MEKNLDDDLKEESEEDSEETFNEFSKNLQEEGKESLDIKESNQEIEESPISKIDEGEIVTESEELKIDSLDNNIEEQSLEHEIVKEVPLELDIKDFHRNLIEAALYAAGGPLTIEELSTKLEFPKKEVEILVNELAFDYLERVTALIIAQIGDRYQMQIRPEYTEKVSKFAKGGAIAERYLRTLTVIALKQPILKSTVIKLRGTGAYEHIKYLLDNEFINAVKKGRSHELTTTDKYADMFGLPRDIRQMKHVMITQLGIEEAVRNGSSDDVEQGDQNKPLSDDDIGDE
ncbi:MAG: SMC-Scp complex subunit ScpB [Promethearchaeota archaeon]